MERRRIGAANKEISIAVRAVFYLVCSIVFLLAGCKSSKKVVLNDGSVMQISYADLMNDINKNVGGNADVYYPKVRYTVTYDGSMHQFTGGLSIKRGEEIFATVNAFLGIEVARVLMNKDSVVVKSNFERKVYVFQYNEMIQKFGLSGDFATIEDVLCYHFSMHKPNLYTYQLQEGAFLISPKDKIKARVDYDYVIASRVDNGYKITDISYCSKSLNDCLNVRYDKFSSQKNVTNPGFIQIGNTAELANIEMVMGKVQYNSSVEHTLGKIDNFEVVRY